MTLEEWLTHSGFGWSDLEVRVIAESVTDWLQHRARLAEGVEVQTIVNDLQGVE